MISDSDAPDAPASPGDPKCLASGSSGHILVADDDPAMVTTLRRTLAREGYQVTTAEDGQRALDHLRSGDSFGEGFDAVVSDLNMPGANGFTVLKTVRKGDLDLPVILLTGSPDLESAVEALEHGAFRYLLKPATRDGLLEVVGRAVQWHRLALVRREAAAAISRPGPLEAAGLRSAFDSAVQSLWLATQPIVSWSAKSIYGYEVLARTREPALRNPMTLFNLAEQLGRTDVLGQAIRQRVSDMLAQVPPTYPMFVKVHPSDLEDPDLLSSRGILSPLAPRVVLEITERSGLEQVAGVGSRLKRLRELGYRIALDDLGAGYSGLASLAHLEPDIVKVDMSLIRGVERAPIKQRLFGTLATLCRQLQVQMVAEGVETRTELECAVALGGDLFQGYLFARPAQGFPRAEY
jgi:EAL domain-containing protein (putative c-di-GMP-specific phosphodiesterase class I)/CheY-like chemotaxis protein